MADKRSQNQTRTRVETFSGFEGIDLLRSRSGKPATASTVNWQIRGDGSIRKRCGSILVDTMASGPLKAVWSGNIDGVEYIYAFADREIKRYDNMYMCTDTIALPDDCDMGNPKFFYYKKNLYFSVRGGMFRIDGIDAIPIHGYVPLVGKGWNEYSVGEINEPFNIFTRKARFSYVVSEKCSMYFHVIYPVETIDYVKANGKMAAPDDYFFDDWFNTVDVRNLYEGDTVELGVTYADPPFYARDRVLDSDGSMYFGGVSDGRLLMWKNDSNSSVCCSVHVSDEALEESRKIYPLSDHIYFPEGSEFTVGDGRYRTMAAAKHYDRLLLFTEGETWMASNADWQSESIPTMNINTSFGCSARGAVAMAGNDPVTVGEMGIYRWNADTDELNECNARTISDSIVSYLSESFFKSAKICSFREQKELWFYDSAEKGDIWVYSYDLDLWYKYSIPDYDLIFEYGDRICYSKDGNVYMFCYDYTADHTVKGSLDIRAVYDSGVLDFGTTDEKRLSDIAVYGNSAAAIDVDIYTDGNPNPVRVSGSLPNVAHTLLKRRVGSRRFKTARVSVTVSDKSAAAIQSLSITAK